MSHARRKESTVERTEYAVVLTYLLTGFGRHRTEPKHSNFCNRAKKVGYRGPLSQCDRSKLGSCIFCEMRAATMCNTPQPPGEASGACWDNCSWADLRSDGHGALFDARTYSFVARVDSGNDSIPAEDLFNASRTPQFFHRYKWARAAFGS